MQSLIGLKISLLGIAVNRVGAENDRGYYGYNGGYSYGYGDAGEYGADPQQSGVAAASEDDAGASGAEFAERPGAVEEDPVAGIVPKRVA